MPHDQQNDDWQASRVSTQSRRADTARTHPHVTPNVAPLSSGSCRRKEGAEGPGVVTSRVDYSDISAGLYRRLPQIVADAENSRLTDKLQPPPPPDLPIIRIRRRCRDVLTRNIRCFYCSNIYVVCCTVI